MIFFNFSQSYFFFLAIFGAFVYIFAILDGQSFIFHAFKASQLHVTGIPALPPIPERPKNGSYPSARTDTDMGSPTKIELRKKRILTTAQRVFAQRGFHDATIAEIARAAKISEASIYEYFSTKEGLLFSIPLETAKQVFDVMDFHLQLIRGAANKLRAIIYLLLSSYQANPDFASILMLLLKHNRRFLETSGHKVIKGGIKNITTVLEEGVASGEFKEDLNIYVIRSMILGTIEHMVTNWVMMGEPKDLPELADPLIDTIIEGIQNPEPDTGRTHWSTRRTRGRTTALHKKRDA